MIFLFGLASLVPLYVTPASTVDPKAGQTGAHRFQIVHFNTGKNSDSIPELFAVLEGNPASLVLLQEVSPEIRGLILDNMGSRYVMQANEARRDTRGVAVLVSTGLADRVESRIITLPSTAGDRPMVEVELTFDDLDVSILGFHAKRPTSSRNYTVQEREYSGAKLWADSATARGRHAVIIGDFNQTPWTHRFGRLVRETGLLNSQRGFGLQSTWNSNWPLPLRIPIDHCLHSQGLVVVDRGVGPNVGSDHLPLLVTLMAADVSQVKDEMAGTYNTPDCD